MRIAYSEITTIIASLEEDDSWRPTRCTSWVVRDLLVHLLGDAQRALVATAQRRVPPGAGERQALGLAAAGRPLLG